MEIVLLNFGLKYKPPKLGIQYHMRGNPTATFLHEISLAHVSKTTNLDNLVKDLLESNHQYLNPKVVSTKQLMRLCERLVKNLPTTQVEEKENFTVKAGYGMNEPSQKRVPFQDV